MNKVLKGLRHPEYVFRYFRIKVENRLSASSRFRKWKASQHMDEAYHGVYVGSGHAPEYLEEGDIGAVVSVARDLEFDISTYSFELDVGHTDQKEEFRKAVFAVVDEVKSDRDTLIHCYEGKERAPSVTATALALIKDSSFEEEIKLIERKRPLVNPTPELEHLGKQVIQNET